MTIEDVEKYYGSLYKATVILNITRANITYWRKKGYIAPRCQIALQELSEGKLKADITPANHRYKSKGIEDDTTKMCPLCKRITEKQ
jgi:hypothetical protein